MFVCMFVWMIGFFFFKHNTAYGRRISDWISDVCSSDLDRLGAGDPGVLRGGNPRVATRRHPRQRAGGRRHLLLRALDRRGRGVVVLAPLHPQQRTEERRVWKEGVRTCKTRGLPTH